MPATPAHDSCRKLASFIIFLKGWLAVLFNKVQRQAVHHERVTNPSRDRVQEADELRGLTDLVAVAPRMEAGLPPEAMSPAVRPWCCRLATATASFASNNPKFWLLALVACFSSLHMGCEFSGETQIGVLKTQGPLPKQNLDLITKETTHLISLPSTHADRVFTSESTFTCSEQKEFVEAVRHGIAAHLKSTTPNDACLMARSLSCISLLVRVPVLSENM